MKVIGLRGKKFGRLTVIERVANKGKRPMWKCVCDCPDKTVCIVAGEHLRSGHTKSCGCMQKEQTKTARKTHGKIHTRLYNIWIGIKARCSNPKHEHYKYYGGKGITVCPDWENNFETFYDWAMNNGYKESLTIDRIDVNENYAPSNCRWATSQEQANNTSRNCLISYNGQTKTIAQLADEYHVGYKKLWARLNKYHWSIEKSLNTP